MYDTKVWKISQNLSKLTWLTDLTSRLHKKLSLLSLLIIKPFDSSIKDIDVWMKLFESFSQQKLITSANLDLTG